MAAVDDDLPPLSRSALIAAALDIVDGEGLAALSMRKVAAAVGAGPMSLYRHVAGKDELLDLIIDVVIGPLPELAPDEPWRSGTARYFTALYDLLMGHPAIAALMLERPSRGPEAMHRGETVLAAMEAGGVPGALAAEIVGTCTWYTLGGAAYVAARGGDGSRFEGISAAEFPTLHRHREHFAHDATREHFLTGLEHLIAGYSG